MSRSMSRRRITADRPAQTLSSPGLRDVKCAVARALAVDAEVLLMDEPLSTRCSITIEMRAEPKRLAQEVKSTVVYVTHDQIEASAWATALPL